MPLSTRFFITLQYLWIISLKDSYMVPICVNFFIKPDHVSCDLGLINSRIME